MTRTKTTNDFQCDQRDCFRGANSQSISKRIIILAKTGEERNQLNSLFKRYLYFLDKLVISIYLYGKVVSISQPFVMQQCKKKVERRCGRLHLIISLQLDPAWEGPQYYLLCLIEIAGGLFRHNTPLLISEWKSDRLCKNHDYFEAGRSLARVGGGITHGPPLAGWL